MDFPKSVPGVGLVAGRYVDENQATGQPGTLITAQAMNALTDEILAVIEEGGMAPDEQANDQLKAAIKTIVGKETDGIGGLPRFTPYVWGGLAAAMPEGDTQSSGQQLTDLMYPTMRAEVTATQFTCTEAVWQADPYKRVTHWSLGDGASWMRPPDKNGVQPGNVGAFYGVGANPAGGKPGTAVTDAIRNITGTFAGGEASGSPGDGAFKREGASSSQNGNVYPQYFFSFDASRVVPVASENRPKTWYGIWMIRMYGRVLNPGALDAAGLNARMDMIDVRVAGLEAIPKPMGYQQTTKEITASTTFDLFYPNATGRSFRITAVAVAASPGTVGSLLLRRKVLGVVRNVSVSSNADGRAVGCEITVYPGEEWSVGNVSIAGLQVWRTD